MIKKILVSLLVVSVISTGCSKNENESTTQEKLRGRWKLRTIYVEDIIAGVPRTYTYTGTTDDYVDFKSDGNVHEMVDGDFEIDTYTILSDQWLMWGRDSIEIQILTNTDLKLYHNLPGSTEKYTETLYK